MFSFLTSTSIFKFYGRQKVEDVLLVENKSIITSPSAVDLNGAPSTDLLRQARHQEEKLTGTYTFKTGQAGMVFYQYLGISRLFHFVLKVSQASGLGYDLRFNCRRIFIYSLIAALSNGAVLCRHDVYDESCQWLNLSIKA